MIKKIILMIILSLGFGIVSCSTQKSFKTTNNINFHSYGTALINEVRSGNLEIVQYLVENGANINAKNDSGSTALMIASYEGKFEVVEYLIEKGANVNAKNNDGLTALDCATIYFKNEISSLMRDKIPSVEKLFSADKNK